MYRQGNSIGNRFEVHQALRGGMGEVYLCTDTENGAPVALKTFQDKFLPDNRAPAPLVTLAALGG